MSIVADQVRRVDSQLDRVHLIPSLTTTTTTDTSTIPRITSLQSTIQSLSTTTSSSPLLTPYRILSLLSSTSLSTHPSTTTTSSYETELEWLLVSKATVQIYGLLLGTLLEQTIPLNEELWYWDEVLGSYGWSGVYAIQTSPGRWWEWGWDVFEDTKIRVANLRESNGEDVGIRKAGEGVGDSWRRFYGLVKESVRERSVADIQRRVLSPVALCREEARVKQAKLRRLREMGASGLGVLMDEGLSFNFGDESTDISKAEGDSREWKVVVEKSIALMDVVLQNVTTLETGVSDFEDAVFASVEDDPDVLAMGADEDQVGRPAKLSMRLQHILKVHVPNHMASSQKLVAEYGRPSRIVRYWLPASILLLSSTTLLRIVVNRKAEIISWIRDLGATVRDFWFNWVIEPMKKVIGTIRHDKESEVAIMSKESLKGDRDSLERMVVEFAIDNPKNSGVGTGALDEAQIAEVRAKVKEGDLTPVLKAYEKDLRKPFVGTVRGDLIRTLLIQVQKTKVDVEVALSGIDALLKSQELVFGFVGLTPGVLVCFAAFRYLGGVFGNRRGMKQGRKAGQTVRVLRNIDRILTLATPTQNNLLSYKDHGLLLCEVHVLRKRAHRLFPGEIQREFLEDVGDLCNINSGIHQQLKVLERIRWGYAKWLR